MDGTLTLLINNKPFTILKSNRLLFDESGDAVSTNRDVFATKVARVLALRLYQAQQQGQEDSLPLQDIQALTTVSHGSHSITSFVEDDPDRDKNFPERDFTPVETQTRTDIVQYLTASFAKPKVMPTQTILFIAPQKSPADTFSTAVLERVTDAKILLRDAISQVYKEEDNDFTNVENSHWPSELIIRKSSLKRQDGVRRIAQRLALGSNTTTLISLLLNFEIHYEVAGVGRKLQKAIFKINEQDTLELYNLRRPGQSIIDATEEYISDSTGLKVSRLEMTRFASSDFLIDDQGIVLVSTTESSTVDAWLAAFRRTD